MNQKVKQVTLIFGHFEQEHLGKDVFLVPYYLGKYYHANTTIVYARTKTNMNMPAYYRGVRLNPLNQRDSSRFGLGYLWRHVRRIDLLMLFHFCNRTLLLGLLFKLLHPKGKLYIKGDGLGILEHEGEIQKSRNWKKRLCRLLYKKLLQKADWISVETEELYQFLNRKIWGVNLSSKLSLLLNGFDEELLQESGIEEKSIRQKENLLLTVGRLGTYQKNTEMLLQAIMRVDMKDWKLVLIGQIERKECDFQKYIDDFFEKNPHLREKVIFVGAIYDKKQLWEWYNRAKVFVFTSRFESFGIVLMEALRFQDYILSTDVGFAREAISCGCGKLIAQEDVDGLQNCLQEIIEGKVLSPEMDTACVREKYSWEFQIRNAVPWHSL